MLGLRSERRSQVQERCIQYDGSCGEDTRRGKKEGSPSLQVFLEEKRHQFSLGDSEWLSRQRRMSRFTEAGRPAGYTPGLQTYCPDSTSTLSLIHSFNMYLWRLCARHCVSYWGKTHECASRCSLAYFVSFAYFLYLCYFLPLDVPLSGLQKKMFLMWKK